MAKIVLAGGSGNLGKLLIAHFVQNGDDVTLLSRHGNLAVNPSVKVVLWDALHLGEWVNALDGVDVLINLCGQSIQCRFTAKNKEILYNSRIIPTKLLAQAINTVQHAPKLWINFSGVSIFNGAKGLQDERSHAYSSDFLGNLSQKWESAFWDTTCLLTHKVVLRISPVLSPEAGIFSELYPLAKYGLAGHVGSGNQFVSWIHHTDFVNLVSWIIDQPQRESVYHACSPNPVTNTEFMRALRDAAGRSWGLPLPKFVAKIGAYFKGVDASLMLETVPVTTLFLQKNDFKFIFPYIKPSFKNLINTSI